MRAVVLVPRRSGFPERERVWAFLREWWAGALPEVDVVEGWHEVGPFNRAAAINAAARDAGEWDVALVADGDVLLDPRQVRAALAVASGTGGPCLAYHERCHLTRHGSTKVVDGYAGDWTPFVKTRYYDSCSSAYAVTRELFDQVGGFDEQFVGWGWEDVAFRCATELVAGVELVQVAGPLWHLWHIVSSGNNPEEPTYQANRRRGERYRAARVAWDRTAIDALLAEHRGRVPA